MNMVDAKRVLETALICSPQPLTVRVLRELFADEIGADTVKSLLLELQMEWAERGVELVSVASGWRFQSRPEMREFLDRLHPEKPPSTPVRRWRLWPSSLTGNRLRAGTWKTFGESRSVHC